MSVPFHNANTHEDLVRLDALLRRALVKSGAKSNSDSPSRLLNLACGRADEMGVLTKVFGKNGIDLTGLDIRDRELDEARDRWSKHLPAQASVEFRTQDCAKLDDLTELGDDFDVTFMRHQNFWNGDNTWMKIYDQALHRLKDDGHLVITSYFDREHALALDAIQELGGELVVNERHEQSRILTDALGKSVDRHVAIFKKSS